MKVKSIQLINFLSYYESNEFEFSDGPTLIIGQNNTGKSKIFDAFNWVLFDKAYDNDAEKWRTTKDWTEGIVNNRAKSECKNNETVTTSISLDIIAGDKSKYSIIRDYYIKKKDDQWTCPSSSELYLSMTDGKTKNHISKEGSEAKNIIYEIFKPDLSKYFFFQGESINEVMSLNKRTAFDKALNGLSKIEVFKNFKKYAKLVEKRTTDELEKKQGSDTVQEQRKIELIGNIRDERDRIEIIEEEIETLNDELTKVKTVHKSKEEELSIFAGVKEHIEKLKTAEYNITSINSRRVSMLEAQQENVLESWIFAATDNMLVNFSKMFNKAKDKGTYPEPVTIQYLKEMLEKETCLICKRDAKKGSDHYNIIKKVIEDRTSDTDDIMDILGIKTHVDAFLAKKGVKTDIRAFYENLEEIDNQIEQANREFNRLNDGLDEIIPDGMSREEIEAKDFEGMMGAYIETKGDVEKFQGKIDTKKGIIRAKRDALEIHKAELDRIIESEGVNLEALRYNLAKDIYSTSEDIVERFMENLLGKIENSSNKHFKKMTSKNKAHSGSVVIDYEAREVYLVRKDGERRTNVNQGDKVSLQISFVAAILSVSNEYWRDDFPFIADAPVSALGGANKLPAVDAMTDIFKQSIIILKDDVPPDLPEMKKIDPIRKLIKEKNKIKNAYELFLEGKDETNQITKVVSLKG